MIEIQETTGAIHANNFLPDFPFWKLNVWRSTSEQIRSLSIWKVRGGKRRFHDLT